MKKLMFAIAALAAGAAMADVTSANIVGYGPTALDSAGHGICGGPSFVNLTGGVIDLTEIKVVGYTDATYAPGAAIAQTRTTGGGTKAVYEWYDDEDGQKWWIDDPSYGDYREVEYGEVQLAPGEGLWFTCTKAGWSLQTSGEVPTKADIETELDTDGHGIVIANPTPVATDLTKCYVSGYTAQTYAPGAAIVQTLTTGGGSKAVYEWYDDEDGALWWIDDPSYGDYREVEVGEVPLAAGQGLWATCTKSGWSFVWPKVDVK